MQISYKSQDFLYNAFAKEAKATLYLYLCGLLGSIYLLWYFNTNSAMNLLTIICLIFIIKLIISTIKRIRTKKFPFLILLERQPESIVWVYSIKTQRLPFGISVSDGILLYFKTINKKEFTVKVSERKLSQIMQFLNHKLPHATFGYSSDNDQWYEADPQLLYKDNPSDASK